MSDLTDPVARPRVAGAGSEARRAALALALGIGVGLLARLFETKEARAWREPSAT